MDIHSGWLDSHWIIEADISMFP